jgi:hypothetical protein
VIAQCRFTETVYFFLPPLWQSNQPFRRLFANFLHSMIRSRGVSVVVELHFRDNFRYRAKRNVTLSLKSSVRLIPRRSSHSAQN